MPKLRPLFDRIVVVRDVAGETTKGGIVIPDVASSKPKTGKVIGVGPGKRLESGEHQLPVVKVGDRVLFADFAGHEVTINDEERLIMREEDILGVID